MIKYVGGYGSSSAKLVVVGEAPGKREEEEGQPFVGPSGNMVNDLLLNAGINRNQVYMTNVVKVRPPDNNIRRLHELGKSINDFIPQLWKEIEEIAPNCILAFGETALNALTGFKGITKYRGSILKNQHTVLPKVVSTIHPASLLHDTDGGGMKSWKDLVYMRADVKRAVEQSKFKELVLPQRTLLIARNSLDVTRFFDRNQGKYEVALDVETFKTYPLCIGLSFNTWEAMSIPIMNRQTIDNPDGIPLFDLAFIWKLLAEFLSDTRTRVIGQNLKFDEKRCAQMGLKLHDVWFDTMLAWKTLYPELPAALEFISSVITEEPYYKSEGREFNFHKDKLDKLLLYNGKDAVVEFECYEKIRRELEEANMFNWFMENVMPLHRLYSDLEDVGLLTDLKIRNSLHGKYVIKRKDKQEELEGLVGHDINANSPKQVANLIYGELKCPARKDTGEDTLKALINNVLKDEKRKRILTLILEIRKVRKAIGTYLEYKLSYN